MSIKRLLKKRIQKIQPSQNILASIKAECGIMNVTLHKKPIHKDVRLRVLMPIMACFVFAITCSSIVFTMPRNSDKTSYVLLEMGAQVQFVTEDNVVVNQQGLNKEAQVLLLGCDYVEENVGQAIVDVVDNAEKLGMIAKGDEIKITTFANENIKELSAETTPNNLNSAQNNLQENYNVTKVYQDKNQLVNLISNKYACTPSSINDKNVDDLIEIYVNYDKKDNMKFYYSIYSEYDNIWLQAQNDLNIDIQYNIYKDLANELSKLIYNIESLQISYNENLFNSLNGVVETINANLDNVLGDLEITDEYLNEVKDYLQNINDKRNEIVNDYYEKFNQDIIEFKSQLYYDIKMVA